MVGCQSNRRKIHVLHKNQQPKSHRQTNREKMEGDGTRKGWVRLGTAFCKQRQSTLIHDHCGQAAFLFFSFLDSQFTVTKEYG